MTLPTSGLSDSIDYTNPTHAATLTVMMQHAQISSSSLTTSCSSRATQEAAASSASTPPYVAAPTEPQEASRPRHNHCIVRRSSLASSCPAPRRSSLRTSSSFCEDGSSTPRRRQQRRRSSVTFNDEGNETKEVPKLECPVQREELFYKPEDYTQFRREHTREKRAEVRERAAMMMRWKATFGSGLARKASSGDAKDLDAVPSSNRINFSRIKSSTTSTTTQFSQNYRRSVTHLQSSTGTYKLPASMKPAVRTARLA